MATLLGPFTPLATGIVACVLALYLAGPLMRAALAYGIVDKPRPPLKVQKEPVPYLGGMVVFLAFLAALAITFEFDQRVLAILLASSLIVSVGLIDDLGTLSPRDKLLGQIVAAVVCVKAGVAIEIQAVPSPLDEIVSVLWLLTCMNAFNILDVSDGLATTAGFVGAVGATVVALLNGEPMIAAMAAALAGAALGFLRVNRQPARMYLGDTGSMFFGTVIGSLAMIGRYSEVNSVSSWFVPLTITALPLFDLSLVIVARMIAGKKIWLGSPDHFAVRLRHHGWQAKNIGRVAGALGLVWIAAGVASTQLTNEGALYVLGALVFAGIALLVVILVRLKPKAPALDGAAPP